MSGAATSQLYAVGLMAIMIGFGVMRRMRPQPVRPTRLIVSGAAIVVLIAASLIGTGGAIIADPVAVLLVPVFTAAGIGLGYYLVRTMTFWSDPSTGALWMKGGALFALILVATIAVRLGVRTIVYGSPFGSNVPGGSAPHGLLYDLTADLLFISLGLWASRAYFLYRRHQAHAATVGTAPPA
jgi:hypothetical protein